MRRTALAVLAFGAIPAVAVAQRTTADSARSGSTRDSSGMMAQDSAGRAGTTSRRAGMGRSATAQQGTSREQVRELQTALNAAGYNVGTPDGIMGSRTRRAAARARRERNVSSNDMTELLNALDAGTTPGAGATRTGDAAAREGRATRDSATMMRDSMPMRDSAATSPPSGAATSRPPR